MAKQWDYDVPSIDVWRECLRVLKPGGHMLAFGGTRTYHRLVTAIEDAGFEIRDQIMWIFGQGFPKSRDVSKAIDKEAGATREVVGAKRSGLSLNANLNDDGWHNAGKGEDGKQVAITAPATDAAREWKGWGTALKPAHEPICVARKPLSESTVAKNVLKWGTGGINVDGCQVEGKPRTTHKDGSFTGSRANKVAYQAYGEGHANNVPEGRWPANLILDEEAAAALDEQSGQSKSPIKVTRGVGAKGYEGGALGRQEDVPCYGDSGGASRFFYIAKSSKKDRGEGNVHPTCKPTKLMAYLCKLITPPGGLVLDPFAGSGSTGVGALREGFRFVGIEREAEYVEIAKRRLAAS